MSRFPTGGGTPRSADDATMGHRRFDYTIVIPVYCNEDCLVPLMGALRSEVLEAHPRHSGEVILVDDRSVDASFDVLQRLRSESPDDITIIRLTRNFGQAGALLAGYEHARGDCIVTISADGQEPMTLVNEMLRGFFDERYEVVICARTGRDESLYRRATSRIYYFLMRRRFRQMPSGGFDAWLMGRRACEVFLRHPDRNPSFPGRILWMGFPMKVITYRRQARLAGSSRFTLAKKLTSFIDGIIAYSFTPIRVTWLSGCAIALLGLAGALFLMARSLLGQPVEGWAAVMAALLTVGGLQMTMIGGLGEYLWRTLEQVRARDMYLIDTIQRPEDA